MPKDKVITIAGQRVTVKPFGDYHRAAIDALFVDGKMIHNLSRHSDFIETATEVFCPSLPKSLYKKVGTVYRWTSSLDAFSELVGGCWLAYWQWEQEAALSAGDKERIDAATEQINLISNFVELVDNEALVKTGQENSVEPLAEAPKEAEQPIVPAELVTELAELRQQFEADRQQKAELTDLRREVALM